MTFYNSQDVQVRNVDTRTAEVFTDNQVRDIATPSLLENVTKGVLRVSSIPIAITRAGAATVVNSAGLIQVAPTNTPRFDHNPVTLAARGLLVEGVSSNRFANASFWTTENVGKVTSTTITSLADTETQAMQIVANGTNEQRTRRGVASDCQGHRRSFKLSRPISDDRRKIRLSLKSSD
jgi:hypothetical protein